MHRSVRTSERTGRRDGSDKARSSNGRPAAEVLKCAKHFACRRFRCKDPERDDDAEETKDVHDQDDAFEDREVFGSVGVHQSADDADADHQERLVPGCMLA